jgi:hypothetical protein
MPYDHKIPTVLNPSGDIVVPLYIPHDPQYTALLLGVLITLEEVERYERDPDFDDDNAQIVAANWRDRTITPLIEAIATGKRLGMKKTIYEMPFGANITISNTIAAAVATFTQTHTFEFKNCQITLKNLSSFAGDNSSSLQFLATILSASPSAFATPLHYNKLGGQQLTLDIFSTFEDIVTGVPLDLQLLALKTGVNGNIAFRTLPIWIIEEWE